MVDLTSIRQRAENGIATLSDVKVLLGYIETMETKPAEVVYVPDPGAYAKVVEEMRQSAAQQLLDESRQSFNTQTAAAVVAEKQKISDSLKAQLGG